LLKLLIENYWLSSDFFQSGFGMTNQTTEVTAEMPGKTAVEVYTHQRIELWDRIAREIDRDRLAGRPYHQRLREVYRFLVPPHASVLELGCGKGDLLAALEPATGVGVDFSQEMIAQARVRHPQLRFICADAHSFEVEGVFDFIILSDLINDCWDVQTIFTQIQKIAHPGTRVIINFYSRLWLPLLQAAQGLKQALPQLQQNWLTVEDIRNLMYISGFDVLRSWQECIFPATVPLLSRFLNKVVVKIWPLNSLGLSNFIVARPFAGNQRRIRNPLVSVIVPARNEAGNIPGIFERVPEMGAGTELVFVEGHSRDNTYQAIEETMRKYPQRRSKLLRQDGVGKGDAVRKGFANAAGDVLMILDADLTVVPEDLPRFYEALDSGKGEFVNGVRLVYPMEKQAMRFLNLLGNKFFSLAFSWVLGQPIKDTLCGTKVIWKKDYETLAANRKYFGDFDPFGDFDLLFGAAKLNLRITDIPIRYRERTYGTTNIQRWKHGWLLLRMVLFSLFRIKFV
jgi:ubiquinone/menaquinone biosynthesis C-methylase UbiE